MTSEEADGLIEEYINVKPGVLLREDQVENVKWLLEDFQIQMADDIEGGLDEKTLEYMSERFHECLKTVKNNEDEDLIIRL